MNDRLINIDIIRFCAIFLVLNSHMGICYPNYSFLATGGAIGDALFFFASGLSICLSKRIRFDNWYKKRLSRIFTPVLSTAIIALVFFNNDWYISQFLFFTDYWFLPCILSYYIIIYIFQSTKYLNTAFIISLLIIFCIFFIFYDYDNNGLIYGNGNFRFFFNFLFMLQGVIIGKNHTLLPYKATSIFMCIAMLLLWYISIYIFRNSNFQIITIFFIIVFLHYAYSLSLSPFFKKNKAIYKPIYFISSLCLECYLVQKYVITSELNYIFPLNIPIIIGLTLILAYVIKVISNFISNTISPNAYNWRRIFQLI